MPINASGSPILSGRSGRDIRQMLHKLRSKVASASDIASALQAVQEQLDVLQGALLDKTPGPPSAITVSNSGGSATGFVGDFIGNSGLLQSPAGFTGIFLGFPNVTGNAELCGATIVLTATQINNMISSPVPVVAGVSGKSIAVNSFMVKPLPGTSGWAGGGSVVLNYHGTGTAASGSIPATVFTSGATSPYAQGGAFGVAIPVGVGIDITNGTTIFASGNGTAVVNVIYTLIS